MTVRQTHTGTHRRTDIYRHSRENVGRSIMYGMTLLVHLTSSSSTNILFSFTFLIFCFKLQNITCKMTNVDFRGGGGV